MSMTAKNAAATMMKMITAREKIGKDKGGSGNGDKDGLLFRKDWLS
jgi:hypothetical protein